MNLPGSQSTYYIVTKGRKRLFYIGSSIIEPSIYNWK